MSVDRYARQRILPEIGEYGQRQLAGSHAVIVGCGALGSVQAQLLARAGVGRLTLIDRDFVERANLQRQILFTDADADARHPEGGGRRARPVARSIRRSSFAAWSTTCAPARPRISCPAPT